MDIYHELLLKNGYVLDPFSKEEKWIYRRITTKYFRSRYNLSLKEVYDLTHPDEIHRCPICGKDLKFDRLDRGYFKYCSNKCHYKDVAIIASNRANTTINLPANIARHLAKQFINRGNPNDQCYIYYSRCKDGNYKFGVTANNIHQRNSWNRRFTYNPIIVLITDRITAAKIERDFKIKYNLSKEYIRSEMIGLFIRFVNEYKLNY